MYCHNCGNPINAGARFCQNCGAKIESQPEGFVASKVESLDLSDDMTVNNDALIEKNAEWNKTSNYMPNRDLKDAVLINGVAWAIYNLNSNGQFETSHNGGDFFHYKQLKSLACPLGWRLPTKDELKKLLDKQMVDRVWTSIDGVNGCLFTCKATGMSLFFPALGVVYYAGKSQYILKYEGEVGYYWSSATSLLNGTTYLYFDDKQRAYTYSESEWICSVRCVKR